jgi:NTP pyrophosphatase (non-canonical NTP hydrolase)
MTIEELLNFIKQENQRLDKFLGKRRRNQQTRAFAQTVKVNEEVGELCNAVLDNYSLQRKKKSKKGKENELVKELADVLITTLLLADTLKIDVKKALEKKTKLIKKRKY